jgi:uncharacterized protein (DUF885 family)
MPWTAAAAICYLGATASAQLSQGPVYEAPGARTLAEESTSEMREVIERYTTDRTAMNRSHDIAIAPTRFEQLDRFYKTWLDELGRVDFHRLSQEGRIDYLLLKNQIEIAREALTTEAKELAEVADLIPFAEEIVRLQVARRRLEPFSSQEMAERLERLSAAVDEARRGYEGRNRGGRAGRGGRGGRGAAANRDEESTPTAEGRTLTKQQSERAAAAVNSVRDTLRSWYGFYNGYDPMFTWWVAEPNGKLDTALQAYASALDPGGGRGGRGGGERGGRGGGRGGRGGQAAETTPQQGRGGQGGGSAREDQPGLEDEADDFVDPIGNEKLLLELRREMIPYSPAELVAIAEEEFAWCDAEMLKASNELGFGDDWRAALEHVKNLYVEPGEQPKVILRLAQEAIDFLEANEMVTIPRLAKDTWRIEMMSPQRQLVNPFFTGGETISVSYPTNSMSHEAKLMSMRGNNPHFSAATVHHELIPGHHLQGFMTARYGTHRSAFNTPFWGEGWALYWELLLYDMGFPNSPEDRVGFLFWRMHRCARIIFSLSYHLGEMSAQESVDFLVDRVGHERANAEGEVRRSFNGSYTPLYQAAYLLGGMQFFALHEELVESGRMTDREFHDRILRLGRIPVEMIRAVLTGQDLTPDHQSSWRFRGDPLGR